MDYIVLALAAGLSILLPLTIICIRRTVKLQRQDIIRDLEQIFRLNPLQSSRPATNSVDERELIVPSFEFVKFKYFFPRNLKAGADPNQDTDPERDIPLWAFLVSSTPLMLCLFALGIVTFGSLLPSETKPPWQTAYLPTFIGEEPKGYAVWLSVLMVAYFGAYIFTVRMLLRAVSNFDLSPATFLSATVHVLLGVITAVLIAIVAHQVIGPDYTSAGLLIGAFVIGFVPDLGLRALLRTTELNFFKREDSDVLKAYTSTPLEVIDGIDSEIRNRLADHHISTVQNLATANPIMLFVETPYGVYQVIDWVAQAQLCTIVGPRGVTELWKLGIRTIFDLERAVLHKHFTTRPLRYAIGQAFVASESARQLLEIHESSDLSDQTIAAMIRTVLDDLHVQRLRQIWNRISERLDPRNLELNEIRPRKTKARNARRRPAGGASVVSIRNKKPPDNGAGIILEPG